MNATVIDLSQRLNDALIGPIQPTPGVFHDVDFETYARWDAVSKSCLDHLVPPSTPAHLKAYLETPRVQTEALVIGEATHCAILEPERFAREYVALGRCEGIKKDKDRCSNQASVYVGGQHFCKVHGPAQSDAGIKVLSQSDFDMVRNIADSVHAHPAAGGLLTIGEDIELSICWTDPVTGEPCKGRIDLTVPQVSAIVDLKSTADASAEAFARSIRKFGYHRQGAMYLNGAAAVLPDTYRRHIIIAYEKVPPYAVAVYRLSYASLDQGAQEIAQLLGLYSKCRNDDHWPAYSDEVEDIDITTVAEAAPYSEGF